MRLYNSLTKKVEDFTPQNPNEVLMYQCGPTVYDYITIGNFRTFALGDFLYRALVQNGYKVKYIMNLTDVGHLVSDNDEGADKLEAAAERDGTSAREVADFYIKDFYSGYDKLKLTRPNKFTRATEYIQEQIDLVETLERKGYTYLTTDGVYFDTSKYKNYGLLSGYTLENIKEGARVEVNPEKKNPTDFALWKFSTPGVNRWQEWNSPWGRGFPGWHAECSAMAMKELGATLDIHLGGEDLKMVHHQNELAQSECATGSEYVKYWVHGSFLLIDDGRMGKSLGNAYTVKDIEDKGFDPLSLRYLYMTAHYRSKLNFTWESLQSAQNALKKLYDIVSSYQESPEAHVNQEYYARFRDALNDDLNMPKAVSQVWELVKNNTISESVKIATLLRFDEVLGFNLENHVGYEVPDEIKHLAKMRSEYRKSGIFDKADQLRRQIEKSGYIMEDIKEGGYKIKRK